MKVANVIEEGRFGGPQNTILRVAESLKTECIETTVILPKKDSEVFQGMLQDKNVKLKTLSLHRLTKNIKHLMAYFCLFPFELFILYRYIKKEKFDIVHASGGAWQIKGVLAGKLAKCKVVWHMHDAVMPGFIKQIFLLISKYFADSYITAGGKVFQYYDDLIGHLKKPISEIQAPVDCNEFNPTYKKIDPKLFHKPGLNVVTVSNVSPVKGLEAFIRSAWFVNKKVKEPVNFWIVGSKLNSQIGYFNSLESLIKELELTNVHFFGSSDDVKSILSSADIYVCSSLSEASPTSVWEAMAMKLPVVSTSVGDVPRFIENNKNGFVVPVGQHERIADCLIYLINKKEQVEELGNAARKTALANFDISICTGRHITVYQNLFHDK